MRKFFLVVILVILVFMLQFFLVNTLGKQFTPNLLMLLLIFINLILGIRFGLLTAFVAGLLLDSYSIDHFGLNILAMILASYLIVLIQRHVLQSGSRESILFLTFLILLFDVIWKFFLHCLYGYLNVKETLIYIFLPEVGLTLLIATTFYRGLRQCVSRLFE